MAILISPPIEDELVNLADELKDELTPEQHRRFQRLIRRLFTKALHITITGSLHLCRDPKDDAYLETSQVGRAHYLVTGDRDLLDVDRELLKKHRLGRLALVTPVQFLERV